MSKELLYELCKGLENDLNNRNFLNANPSNHKVNLVSELRPDNYWLPSIHIGTSTSIDDEIRIAWLVEVLVDNKCIFREYCVPREGEDLKIIEGMMCTRVLRSIFNHGVMSSKQQLDNLKAI